MYRIVFIGRKNNRLKLLNTLDNCIIDTIPFKSINYIIKNISNEVIDLFIINSKKYIDVCNYLKSDNKIKHIPIVILTDNLIMGNDNFDLIISKNISNIEFYYQIKTLLKMKLMDDELKKEKILLELKVKDRTLELEKETEKLKKEKKRAEESDKLKSIFLNNISHEIRTPLNSILGFSSIIDKNTNIDKILEYINIIKISGKMLLHIMDNILDLSKIQAGIIDFEKEYFNLDQFLLNLKEKYIKITHKYNKDIDIIYNVTDKNNNNIYSDKKRIEQILNNLVINAIKFTDKGYVEYGYDIKNNIIEFFVKDTGIGIDKNNFEIIFESFTQLKNKYKDGMGIGLTISKEIINIMGGKIWIESELDKGSIFHFTIPLQYNISSKITNKVKNDYNWENKNIIIVDYDYINFTLIDIILKPTKSNIIHISNYKDFYNYINLNKNINIIIINLNISDKSEIESLKNIKKLNLNIPIIIITNYSLYDIKIDLNKLNIHDIIQKPIIWSNLFSVIDKYLT
jgi:signal transduction histidine kinase